jgi:anhydro-N-acetylmuramic acid kinase
VSSGCYVGLMSGTSLDGVDAVVVRFSGDRPDVLASAHRPFDAVLREDLLHLSAGGNDELERAAKLGNTLARIYASTVEEAVVRARILRNDIAAVGCHGQTVRHRPEHGYSIQIGNAALLAELTGLRVVCDFRSRDIAAGGQGAPLVPAFHAAVFARRDEPRAVLNIGGIANVTLLGRDGSVRGYDTGPGNCLMDLWAARHGGQPYDEDGRWAAGGTLLPELLGAWLAEPYFDRLPPKSTGRELFNERWLGDRLPPGAPPRDVQATLLELTARSTAAAIAQSGAQRVIVCGGGAHNRALMDRLGALLKPVTVESSGAYGLHPLQVEAAAFAWLAREALAARPANLPGVTGARGPRVLGAIYPA